MTARHYVSERRVCRVLGSEKSVMRYVPTRPQTDAPLCARLRALAALGVPRLHWRLIREGVHVNYKRVEWLYRLEGLAVRTRARKRLAVPRPPIVAPNDTWGIDFVSDTLAGGWRFRTFTVVDLCTHECFATTVAHSLPRTDVIATLNAVCAARGTPVRLSLDNRSEFRSRAFDAWAADVGIALVFIQRGKPAQKVQIESFNEHHRDECLNAHWFRKLTDAQRVIVHFRHTHNADRPSRACSPLTPTEYARTLAPSSLRLSA